MNVHRKQLQFTGRDKQNCVIYLPHSCTASLLLPLRSTRFQDFSPIIAPDDTIDMHLLNEPCLFKGTPSQPLGLEKHFLFALEFPQTTPLHACFLLGPTSCLLTSTFILEFTFLLPALTLGWFLVFSLCLLLIFVSTSTPDKLLIPLSPACTG